MSCVRTAGGISFTRAWSWYHSIIIYYCRYADPYVAHLCGTLDSYHIRFFSSSEMYLEIAVCIPTEFHCLFTSLQGARPSSKTMAGPWWRTERNMTGSLALERTCQIT